MAEEKTLEQLQEELDVAISINEQLSAENADLRKEIEQLLTTPETKKKESGVGKTFRYADKEYKLMASRASIPGIGKLTALEMLDNEKAQEWLVANRSGIIKEIV